MICKINKTVIEEFVYGQRLDISLYLPNSISDSSLIQLYYSNYGIYINYSLRKEDIYIQITNLLDSNIDKNNYITYGTNVTDIINVYSKEFRIYSNNGNIFQCFLKKSERISLIMVCQLIKKVEYMDYLGEIKDQIELKDINIKYNFFILPVINEERFAISGLSSNLKISFPKTLDFTLNDSIIIDYLMENPKNSKGMKLNPDGKELECVDYLNDVKRCIAHISHFQNKKSDYYFTSHLNDLNKSIIYYDASPIKVILPESKDIVLSIREENNKNPINIGNNKRVFAFTSNYNDKERNIFDINDNIKFNSVLSDINDYKIQYNISCNLWKPNDDYMRIICNLNENLADSTQMLILNRISFEYNNYKIIIEQDQALKFNQYNETIPFLYSDEQIINIYNNTTSCELKFKFDAFNDNILYICGSNNNYALLDNCQIKGEEVNCNIKKETIEEILTSNSEKFKIGAINDNVGIIPFDQILDITINYENVQKEEIYLNIIRVIGGTT